MLDKLAKKYEILGSGVLCIDKSGIFILIEDKGTFNLASVLADLNNKPVKFYFSYDEDYEEPQVEVDPETGEVI